MTSTDGNAVAQMSNKADVTSARSWEDFLGLCLRALKADPAEHAIVAVLLLSNTGEDEVISELSGLCHARVGDGDSMTWPCHPRHCVRVFLSLCCPALCRPRVPQPHLCVLRLLLQHSLVCETGSTSQCSWKGSVNQRLRAMPRPLRSRGVLTMSRCVACPGGQRPGSWCRRPTNCCRMVLNLYCVVVL
jgi:hypothetical protein